MQIEFIIQKDKESSLLENLLNSFSEKPKNVYMILGDLKEAGFKLIEEEFIDTKIKLFMAIGINKKNTTRTMLENILEFTKDVYYYSNNDIVEFDSNICIFEYTNKAYIFVSSSSFSESGINENISMYNKITIDLKDASQKEEYKKIIKKLTKNLEDIGFKTLDKCKIEELVNNKEIFTTRQYTHTNIMSISELLNKDNKEKNTVSNEEIEDIFVNDTQIPKVDLSDIDIDLEDIDISEEVEKERANSNEKEEINIDKEDVKDVDLKEDDTSEYIEDEYVSEEIIDKDNELYDESLEDIEFNENEVLDINDMLFSKADVKLDVDIKNKTKDKVDKKDEELKDEFKEDELVQVKKLNLNNISNLIMELPNRPLKSQDHDKIKVQNSIQRIIPNFFSLQDKSNSVEIDGIIYKRKNITLEVVDVKNGKKYSDRNAKILQKKGQSYLTIESDSIKNIIYEDKDIVRIIKLSDEVFHLEVISKDMQEYKLWNKLCNQEIKASSRKYGVM